MTDLQPHFTLRQCIPEDLPAILQLQEDTLAALPDPTILRRNTPEMLKSCLYAPQVTIGAYADGVLAGFSVLYFPQDAAEDLAGLLQSTDAGGKRAANYKLCIVREDYRGHGLQYQLAKELETAARASGVQLLCVTISPHNPHSVRNILRLGYSYDRTLQKYGFERNLYYKFL